MFFFVPLDTFFVSFKSTFMTVSLILFAMDVCVGRIKKALHEVGMKQNQLLKLQEALSRNSFCSPRSSVGSPWSSVGSSWSSVGSLAAI
jgi:hypothetical protein